MFEQNLPQLIEQLDRAIAQAHCICHERGYDSEDCRAAWRILEEGQAELAMARSQTVAKAVSLLGERWWQG